MDSMARRVVPQRILNLCLLTETEVFCRLGNFSFPTTKNAPRGSHCGGVEVVAVATRRRRRISHARFYPCPDSVKIPAEAFVLWCEEAYTKEREKETQNERTEKNH